MKRLMLAAAILAALALPGAALADDNGQGDDEHHEHECVVLQGVPHVNWQETVCDGIIVQVVNPAGHVTFEIPFIDPDED